MTWRWSWLVLLALAGCRQLLGLHDLPPGDARPFDAVPPDASGDGPGRAIDAAIDAGPGGGTLSVSEASVPDGDINLTSEGTADWAHWGLTGTTFDHKASGGTQISNFNAGGGAVTGLTNASVTATWYDGTPDPVASATGTGVAFTAPTALQIVAPAGVGTRTLRVYVGGKLSTERMTIALSDGSAPGYTNMQTSGSTAAHYVYTVTYQAASSGKQLSITWADTGDQTGGFAMLLSATLQ